MFCCFMVTQAAAKRRQILSQKNVLVGSLVTMVQNVGKIEKICAHGRKDHEMVTIPRRDLGRYEFFFTNFPGNSG